MPDAHTGAPVHFVSQIEDITGRKQLEENLAVARDQALTASRMIVSASLGRMKPSCVEPNAAFTTFRT